MAAVVQIEGHARKNNNFRQVFRPFIVFFFICGIDLLHDESSEPQPAHVRAYLAAASVLTVAHQAAVSILIVLAIVNAVTLELSLESVLMSTLVVVLNSLLAHVFFSFKWIDVKRLLRHLEDASSDIIGSQWSTYHARPIRVQRLSLVAIVGVFVVLVVSLAYEGVMPEMDAWMFAATAAATETGNKSCNCGGDHRLASRPAILNAFYTVVIVSSVTSHLLFVSFFVVLATYIQANFQCFRQRCLQDFGQLNRHRQVTFSESRVVRTTTDLGLDLSRPLHRRRRRAFLSQPPLPPPQKQLPHPVWALMRRHQRLSGLVTMMDDTFRQVMVVWSFSELTILIFMFRAMNVGVANQQPAYEVTWFIVLISATFVVKSTRGGAINDQVWTNDVDFSERLLCRPLLAPSHLLAEAE